LINELTGKKDTDANGLSFEDRKNLMSGTRNAGPTLAIAAAGGNTPAAAAAPPPPTIFNHTNGSMNPTSDYVSFRFFIIQKKKNIIIFCSRILLL